jgi:KUP system potassium uptake protein
VAFFFVFTGKKAAKMVDNNSYYRRSNDDGDGIITPSITVSSAIDALKIYNSEIPTIPIVIVILAILFFVQQFGTDFIGRFWSVMLVWFTMIGVLGLFK